MTIYFNENKEAFAFEIKNHVASVEDGVWNEYAGTDKWDIVDGVFIDITDTPEYLEKELEEAKVLKLAENVQKRDERLRAGVEFKGVMFDSDTDSKVNIMGAVATLPDDAVVGWNSMENETVSLTKQELGELGGLLVGLTSLIWGENGLNVQFINAINACETLEELEGVEIDYTPAEEQVSEAVIAPTE